MSSVESSNHANSARWQLSSLASTLFLVLFSFAVIEFVCFGLHMRQVGFYLDDWATLNSLYFGDNSFLSMAGRLFWEDSKIIIRPVQAPFFALQYFFFGIQPLGYHIVNAVLETLCGFLLFLLLTRLTANPFLAWLSSALFLLYPVHDSTHYWVLASAVTFSLLAILSSLLAFLEYLHRRRAYLLALSGLFYALSIFNYEVFIGLAALYPVLAYIVAAHDLSEKRPVRLAALSSLPLIFVSALFLVYQRILAPHLGTAWLHQAQIDLPAIAKTVLTGAGIILPTNLAPFLAETISRNWTAGFSLPQLIMLATLNTTLLFTAAVILDRYPLTSRGIGRMVLIGAVIVISSLFVFGLNQEYEPTLLTIVNRINCGSSLGVSMILTAALVALVLIIKRLTAQLPLGSLIRSESGKLASTFCALIGLGIATFLVVGNWSMAVPWTLSWQTQKMIRDVIQTNSSQLKDTDSVVLLNCPRYVMWSPVFDGVWDFQSMVRIATDNNKVTGGVVSERLVLSKNSMCDISRGWLCGTYKFGNMYALIPQQRQLVRINSADEFINVVNKHGMTFGLAPTALAKWQEQINEARMISSAGEVQ